MSMDGGTIQKNNTPPNPNVSRQFNENKRLIQIIVLIYMSQAAPFDITRLYVNSYTMRQSWIRLLPTVG